MKDEILQVAVRQFLKLGVREMSVQKLVETVGISTKTFYKYFKKKEALLEEVLLFLYGEEYRTVEQLSVEQNAISLFLDIWYQAAQTKYKASHLLYQEVNYYYPELEKKIETIIGLKFTKQFLIIIEKGIKEGSFRNDLLPEVLMETVYLLYNTTSRSDQYSRFKATPLDVLLNTMVVYIRGFCTAKGVEELDKQVASFAAFGAVKRQKEKEAAV